MSQLTQNQTRAHWDQARRKAFWARIGGLLRGGDITLLGFHEVSKHFELRTPYRKGIQQIPIKQIIGSVGRYQDFTQRFLPLIGDDGERWRWQGVASLYVDMKSTGPPPIEVYKVGEVYFVKDGNHRVSVSRHLKLDFIEAEVWEYPVDASGLTPGVDLDTAILETERNAFLDYTKLHELRPKHNIRLTAPGGYDQILGQMQYYQFALGEIDGEEISYEDAVTAWHDMLYETTVQIIEESNVLNNFKDRTATDFFIWIHRYHRELEAQYGRDVSLEEAAKALEAEYRKPLPVRSWRAFQRWLSRS